jgi:carbamoyl-phosphate synthase large subunit
VQHPVRARPEEQRLPGHRGQRAAEPLEALASKATGYPLAYVAAKIALGYTLNDLPNSITRRTSAFFEPALDYIVCKFPRWDLQKFAQVDTRIGSEMKSVGEVMAIGRTLPRGAPEGHCACSRSASTGLDPDAFEFDDLAHELRNPSPRRIFAVARALDEGMTVEEVTRCRASTRGSSTRSSRWCDCRRA